MYLEHFGLSAPPFQFTASPMALFMSRTHRDALAALEWGLLHEPSGLTLLIGDSGTGKTTLVCALLARQYREVRAVYLGNPKLSFNELLGTILSQLGVRGGRGGGKASMLNAFAQYALDLPLDQRIAILIDEAQTLSDDALEEFRLLSNLERHGRKAAQIVLAGQYELARRLANPAMRHLNERIGARAVLLPLTPLECRQYIEHRLRLSGAATERIFAPRALSHIVRHSAGIPRRINALCHNSLLLAYSSAARRVSLAMAREVAADYAASEPVGRHDRAVPWLVARLRQGVRLLWPVLGLGLLGVAGFASGHLMMNRAPVRHARAWAMHPVTVTDTVPVVELDSITATTRSAAPLRPHAASDSLRAAEDVPASAVESAGESTVEKPVAAESAPASAAPPVGSGSQYVIVAPGDTLGGIAMRHLGTTAGVHRLMRLNPQIKDAARIYPGEFVYLPRSSDASSKPIDDSDVE